MEAEHIIKLIEKMGELTAEVKALSEKVDAETKAREKDVKTIRLEISKLQKPFNSNGLPDLWPNLPRYQKWLVATTFWGFWISNVDGISNTFYKLGDIVKLFGAGG